MGKVPRLRFRGLTGVKDIWFRLEGNFRVAGPGALKPVPKTLGFRV